MKAVLDIQFSLISWVGHGGYTHPQVSQPAAWWGDPRGLAGRALHADVCMGSVPARPSTRKAPASEETKVSFCRKRREPPQLSSHPGTWITNCGSVEGSTEGPRTPNQLLGGPKAPGGGCSATAEAGWSGVWGKSGAPLGEGVPFPVRCQPRAL